MPQPIPRRHARGHAASGARMFAGGLAVSATLGLAGLMALRQPIAGAGPNPIAAVAPTPRVDATA
jgi:hypothetical protein